MWWGATIYFVMLGCVCGDKTVSATVENNTITTSSIPRSSTENVTSSVISTSSTNFPYTQTFTHSPSTDVFVTSFSLESVINTNQSVVTKSLDVSWYASFSNSLETTSTSYESNSTNTLQPESSASTSPSQVTSVESLLPSSNSSIPVESTTTENFTSSESVLPSASTTYPYTSTIASSFQESSSIYPSSSETEMLSTTTPSLSSVANYTTIRNTVLSSTFTPTETAPSPTSSNVMSSSQSFNTHVIQVSTSYSDIESRSISSVLSQYDSISRSTETIKDTASVEFSSILSSTSSSIHSASSQYFPNKTDSVASSLLTTGNASSSFSDITRIPPQTTSPYLESSVTQITDTSHFISSTASERADSTSFSTDIFVSKSSAASSVYTYLQESSTKTSIAPTSIKEIATQTQLPSRIQSSIHPTSSPPSSSILSSDSTFPVSTHSISSTKDTTVPYSASLYSQNVTSSSSHILTTTESIPTTQRTDGTSKDLVVVNHTFEMIFEGNCEPLVKDKSLLKTFWDQLQEKIIQKLNDPKISVSAANIVCKPLRISFTLYQIPAKKLIFSSLKELVRYVNINVTVFGQTEHYKAVQVNEAPSVMDKDKDDLDGFEEIDLIVLITAGAFCLVLVSAGLVICIRESYRRKRTRTFELANKYQAEDFTLTKIPRPAVNYTEKGEDIHSNGHNSGDQSAAERETLMDSLHLRVNSNENGLMVGITGTLERQKAEPDSSPAPSITDSEHLKVPLVSRQEEPFQSQDNPIYYIDDEHID
ncbi:mucin-2-like isoform X2 [Saccostrea cucullata]